MANDLKTFKNFSLLRNDSKTSNNNKKESNDQIPIAKKGNLFDRKGKT